jgi:hypothetical protein
MDIVHGLPREQHEFGEEHGHSPVADKVALVDFDGTIIPWGPLMKKRGVTPGCREAILQLVGKGYKIIVFTSRLSWTWMESVVGNDLAKVIEFREAQETFIIETMLAAGIPFSGMTAEKVPAEFYIDDKAIRFDGDWDEVLKKALGW